MIYTRLMKGKSIVHGMIHDLHPSMAGIDSVEWTWHLESLTQPEETPADFGI